MTQDHKLHKNQRVKLKKDGQDNIYPLAGAGSEGWVRKLDRDSVGYPIVYIEWDRDHWTYNGEQNQWTLESHFEPVEAEMSSGSDFDEFQEYLRWKKDKEARGESDGDSPQPPSDEEQYQESLKRGIEFAKNADAFLIVAINGTEGDESFTPAIYRYYKNESAGLILETQIGALAAEAHAYLALEKVKRNLDS